MSRKNKFNAALPTLQSGLRCWIRILSTRVWRRVVGLLVTDVSGKPAASSLKIQGSRFLQNVGKKMHDYMVSTSLKRVTYFRSVPFTVFILINFSLISLLFPRTNNSQEFAYKNLTACSLVLSISVYNASWNTVTSVFFWSQFIHVFLMALNIISCNFPTQHPHIVLCNISIQGTTAAQRLRCCATNQKVVGSIPAGVIGIFHCHKILPIALWLWGRLSL